MINRIFSIFLIGIYVFLGSFIVLTSIIPDLFGEISKQDKKHELGIKINQAILKSMNNEDMEAIGIYDEVINELPDYAEAVLNKAISLKRLKRYKEAVLLLKNSLKLEDIDSSNVYSNLKDIYFETGDSVSAYSSFKTSVAIQLNTITKNMLSGNYFLRLKLLDSALVYYMAALNCRLKPVNYLSNHKINSNFNSKYDLRCFELNLHKDKGLAENYNKIGFVLALMKKYDEALKFFHKAINVWQDYKDAIENIRYINENIKNN